MINVKIFDDVAYIVLYFVSTKMNGFILYDLVYIFISIEGWMTGYFYLFFIYGIIKIIPIIFNIDYITIIGRIHKSHI